MTEDEIEVVAAELAKAGGTSWYPGRERGPLLKVVVDRYRDRARLAIEALERYRASKETNSPAGGAVHKLHKTEAVGSAPPDSAIRVGCTVIYRPPGEQRAYPCRVERIEGTHAYLVPDLRVWTGWVSIENLRAPIASENSGTH